MKVKYEIIITTVIVHVLSTWVERVNCQQTELENRLWPDLTDVLREGLNLFNTDFSTDCNSVNKQNTI